jgi:hypothetical protein
MRYLLLIYGSDEDWTELPESETAPVIAEHISFGTDLRKVGAYVASEALQPSSTATTVRVSNGKPLVTDGPYIEAKEQIGGFYLIDVENLDEALKWATRLAGFDGGAVAVWPVLDV